MRVPVEWLSELVGFKLNAETLAEQLTLSGLEVEEILAGETGPVLEVAITPNRGDCLSLYGLARETAAVMGLKWKRRSSEAPRKRQGPAKVTIRAPKRCTRYCGQVMTEVAIGPSPEWMQRRLEACGVRTINNVVDATNYVMLELGQPLHAFDLDRLHGEQIIVRQAKPKEIFITLDGKERSLLRDDLVIADKKRVVALAGVMGGQESEVHDKTHRLFLESAWFDPANVRRTSKRLGLQTESSYRFERGIDWGLVGLAMERLKELLAETAGAVPQGARTDMISARPKAVQIGLVPDHVAQLLGGKWKRSDVSSILTSIGCQIKKRSTHSWQVEVPSHRNDISEEVDLIEEVGRLRGYEAVLPQAPERPVRSPLRQAVRHLQWDLKRHLAALGFSETIHYSFCSEEQLERMGGSWKQHAVSLSNPLSQETSHLRPTLLLSLLATAQYHHHRQMLDWRFFELRSSFTERGGPLAERAKLAGLLSGDGQPVHWSRPVRPVDFYEVKGVVESVLTHLRVNGAQWEPIPVTNPYRDLFHPTRSAHLQVDGQSLGVLGELHPEMEARYELKAPCSVFELDWPVLVELARSQPLFEPYSVYPRVERDIAVVVDEGVAAAQVAELIRRQCAPLITSVRIFDVYRGDQVPAGKKSLAFAYQVGRRDRTLREGELQALQEKIIKILKKELQAGIR